MTGNGGGPAAPADRLSITGFLEELRRLARDRPAPRPGDPLDAAVKRIEKNPAFAQSRLLTRILAALVFQEGEFRRAETAALDSDTLALVVMLMDRHAAGTTTREEWVCAVELARAAELGAQ